MRGDQLARQWQLIQRLARSRAGIGLDELAEDLGCVRRTVYRDINALMYAGFPVVTERRDGRSLYRFVETFGLGSVPFTPDEVMALAFGEDLLRTLEGTVFHDSVASALRKMRASLGPEIESFLQRLGQTLSVMPGPHKRYAEFRDTIRILNDATLAQHSVDMRYRTGSSGEVNARRLDPYHLWYRRGGLYVLGHDHRSGEIRTFAVDRIQTLDATDQAFEVRDDFDFERYAGAAFGVISEQPETVRIRFAARWRTYVEEHQWHESQKLREAPGGEVELEMQVGGSSELVQWVLSFGSGAEVLEPESLRAEVREQLTAALATYAAPAG